MMAGVHVLARGEIERMERRLAAAMVARESDPAGAVAALQEAVALARTSPEAAEWFVPAELLADLADEHVAAGRFAEALAAMHEAIAAGWLSQPDPRCRLAEIHLAAGDPAEAERIWSEVRRESPDDVWLYNHAGVAYALAGEFRSGLRWLTEGLDLALATDDPQELVEQLQEYRDACLRSLEREPDLLHERASTFLLSRTGPGSPHGVSMPIRSGDGHGPQTQLRFAWFPAEEYRRALELFPDLADEGPAAGGADHATYSRLTQGRLREAVEAARVRVGIAPLRLDEYLAWCQHHNDDPGLPATRAAYAAGLDPTQVVAWPPGRNDPCWCRSGRKYKRCCGAY
jgi:tetratricopeptide (TPR) repeat protein